MPESAYLGAGEQQVLAEQEAPLGDQELAPLPTNTRYENKGELTPV